MKIIDKSTGKTIATIITNHSMSLDEALDLVADEKLSPDPEDWYDVWEGPDYIINGEEVWYDDCKMVWDDSVEDDE